MYYDSFRGMVEVATYCRICPAACGLLVEKSDVRITAVRGDPLHPLSAGYTCPKGRRVASFHDAPDRFLRSQKRSAGGDLEPIAFESAVDEIGGRLSAVVNEHGPDSVAMFLGTQSVFATLTRRSAMAWFRSLGSHKLFSTMTIDQSAKWLRPLRLGDWAGGRQRFDSADVWLLVGTNPLVTMQGGDFTGLPVQNAARSLTAARERGLSLIVIDPRRSETAAQADFHLQLEPGSDAVLIAGLIHVILVEHREDRAFCAEYADGVAELRSALADLTPEVVAERTGVPAQQIIEAARVFATGPRGMAMSGTGPDMGPTANLTQHLIGVLNVVCGRFAREGDRASQDGILVAIRPPRAEVIAPQRTWEHGFRSRIGGYGMLNGELPSSILPAEILEPGLDRVRALVVVGGNPAAVFPDQELTVRALRSLELLVTIDPFPTETAQLADFVIAPTLALERADHTGYFDGIFAKPFAQYTQSVLDRPGEVVEDWQFFSELAAAMDLPIKLAGRELHPGMPRPTSEEYLAWTAERGRIPLTEVLGHPHGRVFDEIDPVTVAPDSGSGGRFSVLPDDVAEELVEALGAPSTSDSYPFRLIVRRNRRMMNTLGRHIPGLAEEPANSCLMHPDDIAAIGARAGDWVRITSVHGQVLAICRIDATLRRGAIAMTHGFGRLPGQDVDLERDGANPGWLLSLTAHTQTITAMPLMTAVPVTVERAH